MTSRSTERTTPPPPRSSIHPFSFGWKTGTFRSGLWAWSWLLWTAYFTLPLLSGWVLKLVFDALSTDASISSLLVSIGVIEVVRWIVFAAAIWVVVRWWVAALTLMRTNMLHAQTVSGGPRSARLPSSPSEAISRFHQDTRDGVLWADSWLDGVATLSFAVGALIVMSTISKAAAFVVLLPLGFVTVVTRYLTPRLYAARAADREATSEVTSFLGETFAGVLAFRLAGREEAALNRLDRHTALRRRTAVRDTVLQQTIDGISSSTTDVTIGLTLLALVPAVRSGSFTVGDLALFVAYAIELGTVPRFLARLISAREQAIVSYGRMGELVAKGRIDDVFADCEVTIEPHDTMRTREPDPARVPLNNLTVQSLTSTYPQTNAGVHDISFEVEAGTFTVITGGVGSGKSTLLRALVGLEPSTGGSISWNGDALDDAGKWFVPPNAAHLPQIPRLFSESLADNIALGRDPERLDTVLDQTTLARDLQEMPDGAATTVGSRGLRLSGGQAQRVATARSLLTQPELLVVDDLSSALDVATERELWARLRDEGTSTVIAVSHRQFVIDQADQVITLDAGRIASIEQRDDHSPYPNHTI